MIKTRDLDISVPGQPSSVSAILEIPTSAHAILVLAHGAGAGMRHPAMTALSEALHAQAIATLRFQFPYMERGSKRPDRPELAMDTVAAAVETASNKAKGLSVFAGGKSFGGRMTTNAAAAGKLPSILGIVCFGFPLHPAKKPATTRAAHLDKIKIPILMLQGTRDDLSDLTLLRPIVAAQPNLKLHVLEAADHSFHVLKSSGRTPATVLTEVATTTRDFLERHKTRD